MKHTKEPWFAEKSLQGRDSSVSDMSGRTIAIAYKNANISGDDLANAKRIVACVNACEGITTEALENGLIEHLLEPFYPARQAKKDVQYLGESIFEEDEDGQD